MLFNSFNSHCLSEPVAKPLLTFIDVLLEGWRFIAEEEKEDPASTSARIRVAYTLSTDMQQCFKAVMQGTHSLASKQKRNYLSSLCGAVFMPLIDREKHLSNTVFWACQCQMIM